MTSRHSINLDHHTDLLNFSTPVCPLREEGGSVSAFQPTLFNDPVLLNIKVWQLGWRRSFTRITLQIHLKRGFFYKWSALNFSSSSFFSTSMNVWPRLQSKLKSDCHSHLGSVILSISLWRISMINLTGPLYLLRPSDSLAMVFWFILNDMTELVEIQWSSLGSHRLV